MALPTPPNSPVLPIPNNPFYFPETNFINTALGPLVVGSGFGIDYTTSTITATGGGGVTDINAGFGISVSATTGSVLVTNTGVRSLTAAGGILLSGTTGDITISATGGGGGVTAVTASAPLASSGGSTPDISLQTSGVLAGPYTNADITVDAYGRVTAAANGATAAPATPTVAGLVLGCTETVNFNTALGISAGGALSTGSYNTLVGSSSAAALTNGSSNVAVGSSSLNTGTAVRRNVAVGASSLSATAGGQQNTALGWRALEVGDTVSCNVSVGSISLPQMTDGCFNVGVGYATGLLITTGCRNVLVGPSAGSNLTSGSCNVAVGNSVAFCSASGSCQLAIGFSATSNWLTGDSTKAIKPEAGIIDCAGSCGTNGQVLMSNGANAICWGSAAGAAATPIALGTVFARTEDINLNLNTGLGQYALTALTTGYGNTALGWASGCALTTGAANTFVGENVFVTGTSSTGNTAVGDAAGNTATGNNNVFLGLQSGYRATGNCNTFVGYNSVCTAGVTGAQNVAIGYEVSLPVTAGNCQLVLGFAAGQNWLTGDSTKAIKPGAGIIDCAGSCGTNGQVLMSNGANAICWGAGGGASAATPTVAGTVLGCTVSSNAALGCNAFLSNTTGCCNVAVGFNALCANTTGCRNSAIGWCALSSNTTGYCNTAIGVFSLRNNNAGFNNTAYGVQTLRYNTGNHNTAIGGGSLFQSNTGAFNTATGAFSLSCNDSGSHNTAAGTCALYNNFTGCGNVMVGGINSAGTYAPVFDPTTENDRVMIGSTATTNAYVQVAWQVVSDARDKIVEGSVPHGLEFVKQLEPKSYRFKVDRNSEEPNGPLRYGFLAQDIQAIEGSPSVIIDDENPEKLTLHSEALVPVLVNAIKELSAKVEALEAKLASNG